MSFNSIRKGCQPLPSCKKVDDEEENENEEEKNTIVDPEDGWSLEEYKLMVERKRCNWRDLLLETAELLLGEVLDVNDEEEGNIASLIFEAKGNLDDMREIHDEAKETKEAYNEIMSHKNNKSAEVLNAKDEVEGDDKPTDSADVPDAKDEEKCDDEPTNSAKVPDAKDEEKGDGEPTNSAEMPDAKVDEESSKEPTNSADVVSSNEEKEGKVEPTNSAEVISSNGKKEGKVEPTNGADVVSSNDKEEEVVMNLRNVM